MNWRLNKTALVALAVIAGFTTDWAIAGPAPTPAPDLQFGPPSRDFGSVMVGASSNEMGFFLICSHFSMFNSGCPNISLSLTGPDASNFSITNASCNGASLGQGNSCFVGVRFNPLAAGFHSASLTASADCFCNTAQASLTGSGLPSAPTPTPMPSLSVSGSVQYCSNPVPAPVPNVTLDLTGTTSGSALSDNSGNYQFSSLVPGGSYTVTLAKTALAPGSAGINTVDVLAVQRNFLVVGTPLSGCPLTAADVNGDSSVNTVDVLAIQRFFLGRTTGIANVGRYQFTPAARSYPGVISDQTGQNYDALTFGDVASPFVGP